MCSADVGRKEKPKGREKIASEPKGPNHNCSQVGMIQMPKLCRPLPAGKEKPRGGEQTAKDPKARLCVFQGLVQSTYQSRCRSTSVGRAEPRGGEQRAKDPKAQLYVFQRGGAIHISKPMSVNIGREGKAQGR